jgi:hypothetical protein
MGTEQLPVDLLVRGNVMTDDNLEQSQASSPLQFIHTRALPDQSAW